MTYYIEMRDGGGGDETIEIRAEDDQDARRQAVEAIRDWIRDGEWGIEGACIDARWTLYDADEEEIDSDTETVGIEPDHDALIRQAGGHPDCIDGAGHDWSAAGEGGCRENPGVWSLGGTAMAFAAHCRRCGLHRDERHTGAQRNPGEHDTVSYQMPDSWCAECEREECAEPEEHQQ